MLDGPRDEYRFGEELGKKFMNTFRFLFPRSMQSIHASRVAYAMVHYANKGETGVLFVDSGKMQDFPVK